MKSVAHRLAALALALAAALSLASCSGDDDQPGTVSVTGVSLLPTTLSLTAGGATGGLKATLAPPNATNQGLTWDSDNNNVATVQGNGLNATVTPVAAGSATITVTASDTTNGTKTASCIVTVAAPTVAVAGVTVAPGTLSLVVGGAAGSLTAAVQPPDATDQAVTWETSDASVATVSGSGLTATVTPGAAAGTATITVSTVDGGHKATCQVTVTGALAGAVFMATRYGLFENGALLASHGNQIMGDVTVDRQGNVHAVGKYNDAAAYYLNGERTILPTALTMGGRSSGATGVFVTDDGHVYIAGYECTATAGQYIARLWRDGEIYALQGVSETGAPRSRANAVCVSGGVVYLGGGVATGEASTTYDPVIWRNGVRHNPAGNGFGGQYIVDLGVKSNGNLAVLCSNYTSSSTGAGELDAYARGWNAMKFMYDVDAALTTATEETVEIGVGNVFGLRLCVVGDDVYVSGETYQYAPVYWKNGVKVADYPRPGTSTDSGASIVRFHGGSVYVSGYGVQGNVRYLGLWIDDELAEWPWNTDAFTAQSFGDGYPLGFCVRGQ
jgi:hypothetical protein